MTYCSGCGVEVERNSTLHIVHGCTIPGLPRASRHLLNKRHRTFLAPSDKDSLSAASGPSEIFLVMVPRCHSSLQQIGQALKCVNSESGAPPGNNMERSLLPVGIVESDNVGWGQ